MTDSTSQMDQVSLYKAWAPDNAIWSPWVKPVPFAFWPRRLKTERNTLRTTLLPAIFPPTSAHCAVLIDLPGGESVRCGLLLASLGYRPVPIFSSCPLDSTHQGLHPSAVDAEEVITALVECAPALSTIVLPDTAPPAFLIDALRQSPTKIFADDYFDNRSAIFASDFPSTETLKKAGINRVLIVRDGAIPASPDLGHALSHWQRDGLPITAISPSGASTEVQWPAQGFLGRLFHQLRLTLQLRPNESGGYGRFVSESSGG